MVVDTEVEAEPGRIQLGGAVEVGHDEDNGDESRVIAHVDSLPLSQPRRRCWAAATERASVVSMWSHGPSGYVGALGAAAVLRRQEDTWIRVAGVAGSDLPSTTRAKNTSGRPMSILSAWPEHLM